MFDKVLLLAMPALLALVTGGGMLTSVQSSPQTPQIMPSGTCYHDTLTAAGHYQDITVCPPVAG